MDGYFYMQLKYIHFTFRPKYIFLSVYKQEQLVLEGE